MPGFIQPGRHITIAASPVAVAANVGLLVGFMFGVTQAAAAQNEQVVIDTMGVHELAKAGAQAWTQGAKIYWDNTNKNCTTTATANTLIGVAASAALAADTVGAVRLGIVA